MKQNIQVSPSPQAGSPNRFSLSSEANQPARPATMHHDACIDTDQKSKLIEHVKYLKPAAGGGGQPTGNPANEM